LDKSDAAIPRQSVLKDLRYKSKFRVGDTDLGTLQAEVFRLAGAGYMYYRTTPEFGPVGARVTIALEEIISNQRTPKAALDALNRDATTIMQQAGYKMRPK
jgi:ABC-type glycerol-3-phosphate transport system substrate-binding protein